jgi:uncharacterized protein (TIGR04255 family)
MAKQRHLANAPITEALIDVHVNPQPGLTFDMLKQSVSDSDFGYYEKGRITKKRLQFKLPTDGQPPEIPAHLVQQVGFRMHTYDEKYVAQFRLSGFTLSRMPPYEEWRKLVEESKRLWAIYRERLSPERVVRLATRSINNLHLPMQPGDSYQTYLHKLVDVPDGAPQAVASFFQRFELVDASTSRVNLTIALQENSLNSRMPVILDIDAFKIVDLAPTDDQLWEILEHLRNLKNETFFSSLTEKAADLYE